MPKLFALHDREPGAPVELQDTDSAAAYNESGYGIFHVVNEYEGRRVVENLKRINYWFCDMDTGTPAEQVARINTHLKPSRVVKTRKGYHVYWKAIDATLGNWDRIVKRGIVPALEADPRASDPLRLLRVPGFYHHKQEPRLVLTVAQSNIAYREGQMLEAFPDLKAEASVQRAERDLGGTGGFWARVAQLDGAEVIARLSGHALCNGEEFRLIPTSGGKHNVQVKKGNRWVGSPVWVSGEGRLCGVEGGGSAAAFLKWYPGNEWTVIADALKALFPEELSDADR